MATEPERGYSDQGGDPVCWLDRVCQECGGFITDEGTCACEPEDTGQGKSG